MAGRVPLAAFPPVLYAEPRPNGVRSRGPAGKQCATPLDAGAAFAENRRANANGVAIDGIRLAFGHSREKGR